MKLGGYVFFALLLTPTIAVLTALLITLGTGDENPSALQPLPSRQVQQG